MAKKVLSEAMLKRFYFGNLYKSFISSKTKNEKLTKVKDFV